MRQSVDATLSRSSIADCSCLGDLLSINAWRESVPVIIFARRACPFRPALLISTRCCRRRRCRPSIYTVCQAVTLHWACSHFPRDLRHCTATSGSTSGFAWLHAVHWPRSVTSLGGRRFWRHQAPQSSLASYLSHLSVFRRLRDHSGGVANYCECDEMVFSFITQLA